MRDGKRVKVIFTFLTHNQQKSVANAQKVDLAEINVGGMQTRNWDMAQY